MGPVRSLVTVAVLAAMLTAGGLAGAQSPDVAAQQARLRAANRASTAAEARSRALEQAADQARGQAAEARAREAAAAERIKAAAAAIAAARARIAIVDRLLAVQRTRMAARQAPVLRLVAALQSMARRPPVLGLIQPGSTEDMVHVRAVLGATLPLVKARTAEVRSELARVQRLRTASQAAADELRDGRARLEGERIRLVRLEAEHRARSVALDRDALVESDRALAMGERAREIVGQIDTLGAAEDIERSLMTLPGPLPRPGSGEETPRAGPSGTAPPPYRLPVAGRLVTGLGELSAAGVRARGVTIVGSAGAPAIAPAAGRVLFAGPFRGYRGVVILDHGKGWTSLVSGLGAVSVRVGDRVGGGQRIGRAGSGEGPRVTVELRRRGQPIDLIPLLD